MLEKDKVAVIENINKNTVSINTLPEDVYQSKTMVKALYKLREFLAPYGVRSIIYAQMLHEKSFIRDDIIVIGTFSKHTRELYAKCGKASAYLFGDIWPGLKGPIKFLLDETKLYGQGNECINSLIADKYNELHVFPIIHPEMVGFGGIILYQEHRKPVPKIDSAAIQGLETELYLYFKHSGKIRDLYQLSEKETATLSLISQGKTASDIASTFQIANRTVETRLANARKKLKAHTSSEAVYKALAYGILPIKTQ